MLDEQTPTPEVLSSSVARLCTERLFAAKPRALVGGRNVADVPNDSATPRSTASAGPRRGFSATPSMRRAVA